MGSAAGIDGNLDIVGSAALDLVVERLHANAVAAGTLAIAVPARTFKEAMAAENPSTACALYGFIFRYNLS